MSATHLGATPPQAAGPPRRRSDNLALSFQELFTVIVRLRSNRQQVSDAASFRAHLLSALRVAEDESRKTGYSQEDTRLAVFAVVAFLDESILNSENPAFRDWARRPLQEEVFGSFVAGEMFFNGVDRLLGRDDSLMLADVLEVYYLCLLLGYGGRYSAGARGNLQHIIDKVGRRIYHIRKNLQPADGGALPAEQAPRRRGDPWSRRLSWVAAATFAVAFLFYLFYWFSLHSGASSLETLARRAGA
jgi:type VI secretion system protein ImpK